MSECDVVAVCRYQRTFSQKLMPFWTCRNYLRVTRLATTIYSVDTRFTLYESHCVTEYSFRSIAVQTLQKADAI